ncbi:uncharacterized protein LOC128092863 [Culex pipiens pallens]|uniref:(northern house mosquito) hypothetical protein n=1 Tax=Culex pipiens TaxID=7175 RepID=A0A8D8A9B0_CULPI|nr:uncharacterized protein LOC128092863 [Culex pipiens pallens]
MGTMDLITVIWYVATLIALISFFVVMACADSTRCFSTKPPDEEIPPPPTPAPSYRLFAPPSYESVIAAKQNNIFIISVNAGEGGEQRGHMTENLVTNLSSVIETSEETNRPVSPTSSAPAVCPRCSRSSLSVNV